MKRLIAIAAIGLVGCASVPMGDATQDAALKTFTVAPEKSGIFVFRNETMGAAVKMDVEVDGVAIGQTGANTTCTKKWRPVRTR